MIVASKQASSYECQAKNVLRRHVIAEAILCTNGNSGRTRTGPNVLGGKVQGLFEAAPRQPFVQSGLYPCNCSTLARL